MRDMDRRDIADLARELGEARACGDVERVEQIERKLARVEVGRVERAVI